MEQTTELELIQKQLNGFLDVEKLIYPGLRCKVSTFSQVYDGIIWKITPEAIILIERCTNALNAKVIFKSWISGIEYRITPESTN